MILYLALYIIIFFLGASIGSFIGAIASRLNPKKKSNISFPKIFLTRSRCDNCGKILKPVELIPLLSYIFQKGKCTKCKSKINMSLFWLEIISGFTFFIPFYLFFQFQQYTLEFVLVGLLLSFFFIYLGYFDYLYWEVPVYLILFAFIVFSVSYIFLYFFGKIELIKIVEYFLSGITGVSVIVALIALSKGRGLGFGDAWIFGLVGFILGWKGLIVVFFLSTVVGSLIGLLKAIFVNQKIKGTMIQFIPFISLGFIIAYFEHQIVFNMLFPYL
ncbi:hypothetical protein GF362_05225 [Candidatus Dojkabacteria bacterium]|nr:hypothetical protein [Candidatus Dojkabacteria bacterium]